MSNHHKPVHESKLRKGSALEHGAEHEKDHRNWSRRSFLRNIGVAGGAAIFLNNLPVRAMASSPLAWALSNTTTDRILVLIRLKGGNDGLNMIIPVFDYGTYQANRPTIAIPQNQLIGLSAELAMPNTMQPLQNMWLDGQMKVVNNVGYPDQNLSHFRSSDIWASASDSNEVWQSGWLGRLLDAQYPEFITNPPSVPPAIQIEGSGNLLLDNEDMDSMGLAVSDPNLLYEIAQTGSLYDVNDVPDCYYGEQLGYIRAVANNTFRYAEAISVAYNASTNAVDYTSDLGRQLAIVARLIKGSLGTKFYMVTLDGFDTHAAQNNNHPNLLNILASNVKAFYEDLAVGDFAKDVLCMTISEFGRRPEQNASGGTDHGAAAPMLMFGEGLNGNGFAGSLPDLDNLDNDGNLQFDVDFRRIYATVLEQWLCLDPTLIDDILGNSYDRLPELGLTCNATAVNYVTAPAIQHKALYGQGEVIIQYTLPEAMPVAVRIFDILGKPVATLSDGYQMPGEHRVSFRNPQARLAAGIYVYSIQAGRHIYSQKIRMVN